MQRTTAYRAGIAVAIGTALFLVGVIALLLGKHEAAYSSVLEILGLTGMFATLFAASARLFQRAAGSTPPTDRHA